MRTPQEVLSLAADDCAENWCRGGNERIEEDGKARHCMLGAINVAAGVNPNYYDKADWDGRDHNGGIYGPTPSEEAVKARDEALALVIEKGGVPKRTFEATEQETLVVSVYMFNDHNDQDTVVNALRKAAE